MEGPLILGLEKEEQFTAMIAEMIKERREDLGMNQETLAILAGKKTAGKSWISRVENKKTYGGSASMNIKAFIRLCSALRIKVILEPEHIGGETFRKNY